jgi:tRNA modification GTPase
MKCCSLSCAQPRSYTGEDVVEVHCHGGAFLSRQILGLILAQGARQAGSWRVYQASVSQW